MSAHWADKAEMGSYLGMRFLFEVSRRLGRAPFRIVLAPVVLYFFLTQKSRRDASRQYLERLYAHMHAHKDSREDARPDTPANARMEREKGKGAGKGSGRRPSSLTVFKHFLRNGESILERILAWDPQAPPPRIARHGREAVARVLERGGGALLIGSHLGNMEVARYLALSERKARVNVLVHTRHNPRFISLMARINPSSQTSLFQVSELTPATAMLLKDKVDAGEVVLIAGDRIPLDGKGVAWAEFLGHPAPWPVGPYVLAALLECPVFLLFCLGGNGSYDIHYEPFAERIVLDRATRREELAALARRYADRLAHHCASAPLLWGNIYAFWGNREVGTR